LRIGAALLRSWRLVHERRAESRRIRIIFEKKPAADCRDPEASPAEVEEFRTTSKAARL
jgi:hypothetical protein